MIFWIRTCQECGNRQKATKPKPGELTDSYANSKCRKCHSPALDYGKELEVDAQGNERYLDGKEEK